MLVSLVAPRGIHKYIFPWGLELVSDFLAAKAPDIEVSRINLSADEDLDNVFPRYNRVMGQVLIQMHRSARDVFLGNADFISAYTTQVAAMGDDFINLADDHGMFRSRGKKKFRYFLGRGVPV